MQEQTAPNPTVDKVRHLKHVVVFVTDDFLSSTKHIYYMPVSEKQFNETKDNHDAQVILFTEAVRLDNQFYCYSPEDLMAIMQEWQVSYLFLMTAK